MEFILSKIWAIIFGLVLISTISLTFQDLDDGIRCDVVESEVNDFYLIIEEVSRLQPGSFYELEMDGLVPPGGKIEISGHTIRLIGESSSASRELEKPILLRLENGSIEIDFVVEAWKDSIIRFEVNENGPTIHMATSRGIRHAVRIDDAAYS